jgi:hypothetical protein
VEATSSQFFVAHFEDTALAVVQFRRMLSGSHLFEPPDGYQSFLTIS